MSIRAELLRGQDWRGLAACIGADRDIFFSESPEQIAQAKSICAGCPVTVECLESATSVNEREGVFGGLTAQERSQRGPLRPYKTHCKRGHLLDGENVYVYQYRRYCRECGRQRMRKPVGVDPS